MQGFNGVALEELDIRNAAGSEMQTTKPGIRLACVHVSLDQCLTYSYPCFN